MAAVASASMVTGALSWEGARAYHLLPEGTSDLSLALTLLQADGLIDLGGLLDGTDLGVSVLTPTYRHSFDIMGNIGTAMVALPLGTVSFESSSGIIDVDTEFAQGDLLIGGSLGLVGMPALSLMEYVQHKPGFQAMAAAKLFLPTGDYDPDRIVNFGLNRWSFQASLPVGYVLGDTMIDPELTTFEIRPVLQIFGDNEDAYGPASVASIAPIFGVEGHVTRNFGNSLWAGLDAFYETGGETSVDGVPLGDGLETVALGATLGLVLTPAVAMRLSYRELVYSNQPEASGRSLEITSAFLF